MKRSPNHRLRARFRKTNYRFWLKNSKQLYYDFRFFGNRGETSFFLVNLLRTLPYNCKQALVCKQKMEKIVNTRIFQFELVEFQRLARVHETTTYKLGRKIIRDYLASQNKTPKSQKQPESFG